MFVVELAFQGPRHNCNGLFSLDECPEVDSPVGNADIGGRGDKPQASFEEFIPLKSASDMFKQLVETAVQTEVSTL